jgi:hypothetical protein
MKIVPSMAISKMNPCKKPLIAPIKISMSKTMSIAFNAGYLLYLCLKRRIL